MIDAPQLTLKTALEPCASFSPDEQCGVCLERLADSPPNTEGAGSSTDSNIVQFKVCGNKHAFHKVCILAWLMSAKPNLNTCPCDRNVVYGTEPVRQSVWNPSQYVEFPGHDVAEHEDFYANVARGRGPGDHHLAALEFIRPAAGSPPPAHYRLNTSRSRLSLEIFLENLDPEQSDARSSRHLLGSSPQGPVHDALRTEPRDVQESGERQTMYSFDRQSDSQNSHPRLELSRTRPIRVRREFLNTLQEARQAADRATERNLDRHRRRLSWDRPTRRNARSVALSDFLGSQWYDSPAPEGYQDGQDEMDDSQEHFMERNHPAPTQEQRDTSNLAYGDISLGPTAGRAAIQIAWLSPSNLFAHNEPRNLHEPAEDQVADGEEKKD
jgi:hypothetical protein